jgi:hypothetical protein
MPNWLRSHPSPIAAQICGGGSASRRQSSRHTPCAVPWPVDLSRSLVLSPSCRRYASGARCSICRSLQGSLNAGLLTLARTTPSGLAATIASVRTRSSLAPCHISGAARRRAGLLARLPDVVLGSGALARSLRPTTTAHESLGIHEKRNAHQCLATGGVPDRDR